MGNDRIDEEFWMWKRGIELKDVRVRNDGGKERVVMKDKKIMIGK